MWRQALAGKPLPPTQTPRVTPDLLEKVHCREAPSEVFLIPKFCLCSSWLFLTMLENHSCLGMVLLRLKGSGQCCGDANRCQRGAGFESEAAAGESNRDLETRVHMRVPSENPSETLRGMASLEGPYSSERVCRALAWMSPGHATPQSCPVQPAETEKQSS